MWCNHENFLPIVHEAWNKIIPGCLMVQLSGKLKYLKHVLKKWNNEVFARVDVELKEIEGELLELEQLVQQDDSSEVENALLRCKQKHLIYMHRE